MGVRGEIFSSRVLLPNRTYFFNVKENRMGDLYLNIVESKNKDTGGFERQSVILFADDLPEFLKGFEESLKVLEKAGREKRKKPRENRQDFSGDNGSHASGDRDRKPKRRMVQSGGAGSSNAGKKFDGDRPHKNAGSRRSDGHSGGGHDGGKRVVVRKKHQD